jgi:hypothetical protein
MREEGDRGRPAEEGGHKPLKISLNAETRAALAKVKKKQPVSKFIEEVIQPLARQFDPGPSSPLALEIMEKIKSERNKALKREDMEEVVALDYFLLRVKPAIDPFVAMSEPEFGPKSVSTEDKNRSGTNASLQIPEAEKGLFTELYTKAALARLYYILDYLIVQFGSVFSPSRNIVDLKVVKVIREPKYISLFTALRVTGLVSGEFSLTSYQQFNYEMTERRDLISRVLNASYPAWSKEIERPPETQTRSFWLPDYLLSIRIDHTRETYKANVLAKMSSQFSEIERNLTGAEELTRVLKPECPELADTLQLLRQYRAFVGPGIRLCREYEERNRRTMKDRGSSQLPFSRIATYGRSTANRNSSKLNA